MHSYLTTRANRARPEIKVDPKLYDAFVGKYSTGPEFTVVVARDGNRLTWQRIGVQEEIRDRLPDPQPAEHELRRQPEIDGEIRHDPLHQEHHDVRDEEQLDRRRHQHDDVAVAVDVALLPEGVAVHTIQHVVVLLAHRIQLTSDGHKSYLDAVERAFGDDIDYAMLVKHYGAAPEGAQRRYSPAECIGTTKGVIRGTQFGGSGAARRYWRWAEPDEAYGVSGQPNNKFRPMRELTQFPTTGTTAGNNAGANDELFS